MVFLAILLRSVLGGVFLISAATKIAAPRAFVDNVVNYRILPNSIAKAFGWLLLPLELITSILLLTGVADRIAAGIVGLILLSFIAAITIVIARGQSTQCSCFGLLYRERVGWATLTRDALLLAAAAYVLVAGDLSPSLFQLTADFPAGEAIVGIVLSTILGLVSIGIAILSATIMWARKSGRPL